MPDPAEIANEIAKQLEKGGYRNVETRILNLQNDPAATSVPPTDRTYCLQVSQSGLFQTDHETLVAIASDLSQAQIFINDEALVKEIIAILKRHNVWVTGQYAGLARS